jgi:putative endonuclease
MSLRARGEAVSTLKLEIASGVALAMTVATCSGKMKTYYVYIMTNKHHTVLYTGVTNNLKRRVYEHKVGQGGNFTSRYNVNKLVYYQVTPDVKSAIAREKPIKAGSRQKKLDLINEMNPEWIDLYETL